MICTHCHFLRQVKKNNNLMVLMWMMPLSHPSSTHPAHERLAMKRDNGMSRTRITARYSYDFVSASHSSVQSRATSICVFCVLVNDVALHLSAI